MKRDPRLHGLSSEHHHALVLARALATWVARGRTDAAAAHELAATFERELEPHFRIEEELLLPALARLGEAELVARTTADHAALRAHAERARAGDATSFAAFSALLTAHVRFEERELFPAAEARLGGDLLDAVARRSPPPRG